MSKKEAAEKVSIAIVNNAVIGVPGVLATYLAIGYDLISGAAVPNIKTILL